ncbi:MAG TPA: hypothetical protein PKW05_02680, partial [Anaerolineae bacterium]|nr:hypothetical protein [Anaerolineae bacterium]
HPKAKKLMLLDNQVARNSEDSDRIIAELLAEIEQTEDLLGTGYTAKEVDELIAGCTDQWDNANVTVHDGVPPALFVYAIIPTGVFDVAKAALLALEDIPGVSIGKKWIIEEEVR